MKRVIFFGSRTWMRVIPIRERMRRYDPASTIIVHGACKSGADRIAHFLARDMLFRIEEFPADWKKYGRAAGPIRNETMCRSDPDYAEGFRDAGPSRGTVGMCELLMKYEIPGMLTRWNGEISPIWSVAP
jgi:hypothetical protein